jgi:hypothetical protein
MPNTSLVAVRGVIAFQAESAGESGHGRPDLKPRDRIRLSGTRSEGVVQAVKDNAVTVKLDGDGTITTSAYQVELVAAAKGQTGKAKKRPLTKKRRYQ